MTINAGTHLGRYEIRSQIAAGGMDEVYQALDTELDRTVAIKILPEVLEKSYQDHSPDLSIIKVDPLLGNLHSDEQFTNLVRRIGLQP